MKRNALAFGSGLIFAIGLGLSGMTQPSKIVGFLDPFGPWDPSLGFVMLGAIPIFALAFRRSQRLRHPALAAAFPSLARSGIDSRLIGGAAVFGVGWGLSGYCPGPAIVSLSGGARNAWLFVPAMLLGIGLVRFWDARRAAPAEQETGAEVPV